MATPIYIFVNKQIDLLVGLNYAYGEDSDVDCVVVAFLRLPSSLPCTSIRVNYCKTSQSHDGINGRIMSDLVSVSVGIMHRRVLLLAHRILERLRLSGILTVSLS